MNTQTLSVTLPSEVIYVSGTVNGTAYTWTLVGEAWQAIVERAADEKYLVALTAVTAAGNSASYELTLYYGILNLITDRVSADANRVRTLAAKGWGKMTEAEQKEFLTALKGAYNAEDLNRVGAAVDYLAGRFKGQGYAVAVETKTDWLNGAEPTADDWALYLGNVAHLRGKVAVKPTTPMLPTTIRGLTVDGANAIEQVLVDLDALLTNAEKAWFYSGEIYSGEV